jgi:hypothetical protein
VVGIGGVEQDGGVAGAVIALLVEDRVGEVAAV